MERNKHLNVRCTEEEKKLWDKAALAFKRTMSDWIRLTLNEQSDSFKREQTGEEK